MAYQSKKLHDPLRPRCRDISHQFQAVPRVHAPEMAQQFLQHWNEWVDNVTWFGIASQVQPVAPSVVRYI